MTLAPNLHRLLPCFSLILAISAAGQTRRALLIGVQNYAPPAGASVPVPAAGHAPDSRFADGFPWKDLHGPLVDIEEMQVLLKEKFDFQNISVLPEQRATRDGILAAIDRLVSETRPGDLVVFYYAGHGSRRVDTLSSKNHFDETIVPIDAWKGADDIRDKELALRFNQIVYEKRARLTAIFDSCNSGTMARGATASVVRALAYDDRDVAEQKKKDPRTVVEADLKRIPQKGNAIILAAAASTENAVEAQYTEDFQWHGAFSRALVHVLRSSTQTLRAADVVAEVSNMLHADNTVPFQQPSVEGRKEQSLFGAPVPEHPLHVHVVKIEGSGVKLDMGSAGGFDAGTQFAAVEPGDGGKKTLIEVRHIDEPLASTAEIVGEPAAPVEAGQIFELSKLIYPRAARLAIFAAKPEPDPAAAIAQAKALFPGLKWIDDPTGQPIDFLVANAGDGWVAYGQNGRTVAPGAEARGTAFLLLGPPASVRAAIEQSPPFQRNAFTFTQKLSDANYLLAVRPGRAAGSAVREYAFIDPIVLAPHAPDAWVRSAETDPDDAELNGGQPPEVVCRNDVSLPVRTGWLPERNGSSDALILALNRRIVRLGKLRVWLQSPDLSPGAAGWPYHPAATQPNSDTPISGVLRPDQSYDIRMVTTAQQRAAGSIVPKYVYLLGFDCAANPALLYPNENQNGEATLPQPGANGVYNLSVPLILAQRVGPPFGADTLFLLVTAEKLTDPNVLKADGVLQGAERGIANGFDELVNDMSDANTRGLPPVRPTNWAVQQLVIPSRN